jgi:Arc/MetJ-type ribon-helix-helix transcriptional regulator
MKLSVSLSDEDVEFLDAYGRENATGSRSATLQHAVRLLRCDQLEQAYAQSWQEWQQSGDAEMWEAVAGDGIPG